MHDNGGDNHEQVKIFEVVTGDHRLWLQVYAANRPIREDDVLFQHFESHEKCPKSGIWPWGLPHCREVPLSLLKTYKVVGADGHHSIHEVPALLRTEVRGLHVSLRWLLLPPYWTAGARIPPVQNLVDLGTTCLHDPNFAATIRYDEIRALTPKDGEQRSQDTHDVSRTRQYGNSPACPSNPPSQSPIRAQRPQAIAEEHRNDVSSGSALESTITGHALESCDATPTRTSKGTMHLPDRRYRSTKHCQTSKRTAIDPEYSKGSGRASKRKAGMPINRRKGRRNELRIPDSTGTGPALPTSVADKGRKRRVAEADIDSNERQRGERRDIHQREGPLEASAPASTEHSTGNTQSTGVGNDMGNGQQTSTLGLPALSSTEDFAEKEKNTISSTVSETPLAAAEELYVVQSPKDKSGVCQRPKIVVSRKARSSRIPWAELPRLLSTQHGGETYRIGDCIHVGISGDDNPSAQIFDIRDPGNGTPHLLVCWKYFKDDDGQCMSEPGDNDQCMSGGPWILSNHLQIISRDSINSEPNENMPPHYLVEDSILDVFCKKKSSTGTLRSSSDPHVSWVLEERRRYSDESDPRSAVAKSSTTRSTTNQAKKSRQARSSDKGQLAAGVSTDLTSTAGVANVPSHHEDICEATPETLAGFRVLPNEPDTSSMEDAMATAGALAEQFGTSYSSSTRVT